MELLFWLIAVLTGSALSALYSAGAQHYVDISRFKRFVPFAIAYLLWPIVVAIRVVRVRIRKRGGRSEFPRAVVRNRYRA